MTDFINILQRVAAWLASISILGVLLLPICSVVVISIVGLAYFSFDSSFFAMTATTLALAVGTVVLASIWGVGSAWLVEVCRFPGRRLFAFALFLPFAMPPYLIAYVWADLVDDGGWLPLGVGLRNLVGACVVMSLVLYPYIYLFVRASFAQRASSLFSAARLLGCTPIQAFWRVALPVAQPAIAAGGLLVFMETANDIAVAEDFGLRTLGYHVYDVWLNRDGAHAAASVSLVLMLVAVLLAMGERFSRRRQRQYEQRARNYSSDFSYTLTGVRAAWALLWCGTLFVAAFGVPVIALLSKLAFSEAIAITAALHATADSLRITALVVLVGLLFGGTLHLLLAQRNLVARVVGRLAQVGYSFPGTIYALGAITAVSWLANKIETHLDVSLHWLWVSSLTVLVLVLASRFVVVIVGAFESGAAQVSPRYVAVARSTGKGALAVLLRVYLPLMRPALFAGILLLFVDVLKELPLTLILRPFGTDTLAVQIYQYAADEDLGNAVPAALTLVLLASVALGLAYRWQSAVWEKAKQ